MLTPPYRTHVWVLIGVALAAYAAGFGVYFLKDDLSMAMFTAADGSLDAGAFARQLLWPVARTWDDIWRPVPGLSWGVDYLLFGADPWGFHLANILGHALNCVLLYWLLQRLLRFRDAASALYGALFFALYPLFPEAILWTTQRTVVFGLMFSLAALLAWHVWLLRAERRHFWIATACSGCALLSREHALSVAPLMGVMALLWAPATRKRKAFLAAVAVGCLTVIPYFLVRHAIFGRFTGGYAGWESMSAYARDNTIFEDLPRTLQLLFLPVPAGTLPPFAAGAANAVLALAWIMAGVMCWRARTLRSTALLAGAWLLLSWAPVLSVFEIYPNLLNARSAYHLMALPIGFLGAALGAGARGGARLLPLLPLLVCAALLAQQVSNYVGAGAQVRGLQCALLATAGQHSVVVDVPTEYRGAPSVDAYLPWLLSPPYAPTRTPVTALVQGLESNWWPALNAPGAANTAAAPALASDVHWFRACPEAPWLQPLFGVADAPEGDAPELLAPADQILVRMQGAGLPELEVRVPAGAHSADLLLEVPGRKLTLPIPLQHLRPSPNGAQRIALARILEQYPALAQWPLPSEVFASGNPLPVQWRIAVKAADQRPLGVSASRRMLLANF